MFGELSQKESKEFLESHIYGHLGCHAFGKTYIIPISYAAHDDVIYCHTFEGLKMDMMRNNEDVCFQVDQIDSRGGWKSVIAYGTFSELTGADRKKGVGILLDREVPALVSETVKISPQWPFPTTNHEDIPGIIFSIKVREITGRFEESDAQPK